MRKTILKNRVLIIILILLIALPLLVYLVQQQQIIRSRATGEDVVFSLVPSTGNFQVNQQFSVDVMMNAGSKKVQGVSVRLNSNDPQKLRLDSFTHDTTTFPTEIQKVVNTSAGSLVYEAANTTTQGVTGLAVKIGTLRFTGTNSGSFQVVFGPTNAGNATSSLTTAVNGGTYNIGNTNPPTQPPPAVIPPPSSGNPVISFFLVPDQASFTVNQQFNVVYKINAGNKKVQGISTKFRVVDPTKIRLDSFTPSGTFPTEIKNTLFINTLTYEAANTTPAGVTGTVDVGTLKFTALAAGTSDVVFDVANAGNSTESLSVGSSKGSYTVTAGTGANQSDLTITSGPTLNSGTFTAGVPMTFKSTITNNGAALASPAFSSAYVIIEKNSSTGAEISRSLVVPNTPNITNLLPPQATQQVISSSITFPASRSGFAYIVRFCADDNTTTYQPGVSGVVPESNESNNCNDTTFTVGGGSGGTLPPPTTTPPPPITVTPPPPTTISPPPSGTTPPPPVIVSPPTTLLPPSGITPPSGGTAAPTPNAANFTKSYRVGESEAELNVAPEKPYTSFPIVLSHEFSNTTPGIKQIWVEFIAANDTPSKPNRVRKFSQIELVGPDPVITGCSVNNLGGGNFEFSIKGKNFGATPGGTIKSDFNSLTKTRWTDTEVKATWASAPTDNNFPVTLTRADGQLIESFCSGVSQLFLGAKLFCRVPQKFDVTNVDVVIAEGAAGGRKFKETVTIDKDGIVQGLKTKLEVGKAYRLSINAPKSIRRSVDFVAQEGTTTVGRLVNNEVKPLILPIGDIFPLADDDGIINAGDYSELVREWSIDKDVPNRAADFNQDKRVNSGDWSCMRNDFNAQDEPEPVPGAF